MANLKDLTRQHKEIYEILEFLKNHLEEDSVRSTSSKLAQNINVLAGKLKIHLITEDDYLYPKLMSGDDSRIRGTAERFYSEMGGLSETFAEYKSKYNISPRILGNIEGYIKDTKAVLEALQNRMKKEDHELYILL